MTYEQAIFLEIYLGSWKQLASICIMFLHYLNYIYNRLNLFFKVNKNEKIGNKIENALHYCNCSQLFFWWMVN